MPSIAHVSVPEEQPTRRRLHRAPRASKAATEKPQLRGVESWEEPPPSAPRQREGSPERTDSHSRMLTYFRELRRPPLLTREQEKEIAVKFAETADPKLASKLVTANLRLVVKIALEYRTARRNLLDLVQ